MTAPKEHIELGEAAKPIPRKLVMPLKAGMGQIFILGTAALFGFGLAIGLSILWAHPEVIGGYCCSIISLIVMAGCILFYRNPGAIYDNGVIVPRYMYERMVGRPLFYRYEDLLAVYPAMFVSASDFFTIKAINAASPYRYVSRFPRASMAAALLRDSGKRWGVGIETKDGSHVLYSMPTVQTRAQARQGQFPLMMQNIQYYMDQKGLPLIRKPLMLSEEEVKRYTKEAEPIPFHMMLIAVMMGMALPLVILIGGYLLIVLFGFDYGEWNAPMLMAAVVIGTLAFVAAFQNRTNRLVRASNKMTYYMMSQGEYGQ
jgi:hypothetical protein